MAQRKNYTDEFRQEAVRLLQMSGKSARNRSRVRRCPIGIKPLEKASRRIRDDIR